MNRWIVRASWWQLALVLGSAVALVRLVASRILRDEAWRESLLGAAVGGATFGLVVGPVLAWRSRRVREALGTDDPGVIRRAARVARRGPVPEDPTAREQGHRMAAELRDQALSARPLTCAAIVLLAGLAVVAALVAGEVALLVVLLPLPAAMGALAWWVPRRYGRRAELLGSPPG